MPEVWLPFRATFISALVGVGTPASVGNKANTSPALSNSISKIKKGRLTMNIFVGSLSYMVTETEVEEAFAQYGVVDNVNLIRDRLTGQPRGFAFVEMSNDAEARNAIHGLDGRELRGRAIKVNEARPRAERQGGSHYGKYLNRGRPRW